MKLRAYTGMALIAGGSYLASEPLESMLTNYIRSQEDSHVQYRMAEHTYEAIRSPELPFVPMDWYENLRSDLVQELIQIGKENQDCNKHKTVEYKEMTKMDVRVGIYRIANNLPIIIGFLGSLCLLNEASKLAMKKKVKKH